MIIDAVLGTLLILGGALSVFAGASEGGHDGATVGTIGGVLFLGGVRLVLHAGGWA